MPELAALPTVPAFHLLLYMLGGLLCALAALATWDVLQRQHTLRHNYPGVAWLRYILESQREKIQQALAGTGS